jgi:hypothetical protein
VEVTERLVMKSEVVPAPMSQYQLLCLHFRQAAKLFNVQLNRASYCLAAKQHMTRKESYYKDRMLDISLIRAEQSMNLALTQQRSLK